MGEIWKPDEHGVIILDELGNMAFVPPDEFEVTMVCPDCGEDTLEGNCSCWEWEYSEGFEE